MSLADSAGIVHYVAMESSIDPFDTALIQSLERLGIPIDSDQIDTLRGHFQAVVEANRAFNLTRITDPVEAAVKHYADSLALMAWTNQQQLKVRTLLDIGTGAGFPAIPLAVMNPSWEITGLEATGKKTDFLTRTAKALGITNLHVERGHSDHWKPQRRFQLVVLRAVAKLAVCLRQGAQHLAEQGRIVAYKTASLDREELDTAKVEAANLKLRKCERFVYDLPHDDQTLHRALHVYEQMGQDA